MDSGRQVDLLKIDRILNDPSKELRYKRAASRAKAKILAQLKDERLTRLRERLMKASRADDEWEMWKITNQIKDYLGEEGIEWWSTKDDRHYI